MYLTYLSEPISIALPLARTTDYLILVHITF